MEKLEFHKKVNFIFNNLLDFKYTNELNDVCSNEEIDEMKQYLLENWDKDTLIEVYGYEFCNDRVILRTELGSFLIDYKHSVRKSINYLNSLCENKKIPLLQLFGMLKHNGDVCDYDFGFYYSDNDYIEQYSAKAYYARHHILERYLECYYMYRMILDSKYAKRLFLKLRRGRTWRFVRDFNCIPLEYLNVVDFNYYSYMNDDFADALGEIYKKYYRFDENFKLMFAVIIYNNDLDMLDYIKDNMVEFKEFILEDTSTYAFKGVPSKRAYDFLIDSKLINLFSENELMNLYKKNPANYYSFDKEYFTKLASKIPNKSPVIALERNSDKCVHIQYRSYDLYDGVPIAKYVRNDFNNNDEIDFLSNLFAHNSIVIKLYKKYYRSYIKMIGNFKERDNLKDFINIFFKYNNLKMIFENSDFNWREIESLITFKKFYNTEEVSKNIKIIYDEYREKSLKFYNFLVLNQDNFEKIDKYLIESNISTDEITRYILDNKFLYSKEKSALLKIINRYYGNVLRVCDILELLDEMLEKELTLDEILKEKEIPKREFYNIYYKAREENPILYECIFESLSKNKRRGFIKLINFGYLVLGSDLSSFSDYQDRFHDVMEFDELLLNIKNTSLYNSLLEKASGWDDYSFSNKLVLGKIKKQV